MAKRRRSRLRQSIRHTALELRKWSKTRLIRLILRLEAVRVSRIGRRVKSHSRKRGRKSGKKRLSAGIHHVSIRGKSRKVKVLANGQWRFMKGGSKSKRRTRRRRR